MHSVPQQMAPPRLVSALCVGEAPDAALIAACAQQDVAVVVSPRSMHLLDRFRVDAVVCLAADQRTVRALAGSKIPVVLLATESWEWEAAGVTVVCRHTHPATAARLIREAVVGPAALPLLAA